MLNQKPEGTVALLECIDFHNFKVVSGTACLNEFESFSHSFENIINLAAKKQIPVDRAVIDLFYDGFDQIDKGVKMLQQNKDPSNIFTDLSRKFDQLRERSGSDEHDQNRARLKELFTQYGLEEFKPESLVFDKKDQKFYDVTIKLDPNIKLKTARLFVIIKKMSEIGTIAKSKPDYANLLQGSFEYEFTLFIQSGLPVLISKKIYSCGEVDK